jgi:hypothetical protein
MGSDAVVARGPATVDGQTFFGQNLHGPNQVSAQICLKPGRDFAPGELCGIPDLVVPQVRHTQTVLGLQAQNSSGYRAGLNSARVAAGCLPLEVRLRGNQPGLTGPDLVRLVLERSRSAHQGMEVLVALLDRFGQGSATDDDYTSGCDHAFLIADPRETIWIETAGKHWVAQEIGAVRALASSRTIRQDWDRISPALSDFVIGAGAWPADGSKIDFVDAIGDAPEQHPRAFKRWGRAMLLLEEQNGHIDSAVVRRLLRDHGEDNEGLWMPSIDQTSRGACRHAGMLAGSATQASFIATLTEHSVAAPVAWVAFGPPCRSVYFPFVVTNRLPESLTSSGPESLADQFRRVQGTIAARPEVWPEMRDAFDRLQVEFDHCVEEFAASAVPTPNLHDKEGYALMEHCLARLEATLALALDHGRRALAFAPGR